jgi:hypothetical protein
MQKLLSHYKYRDSHFGKNNIDCLTMDCDMSSIGAARRLLKGRSSGIMQLQPMFLIRTGSLYCRALKEKNGNEERNRGELWRILPMNSAAIGRILLVGIQVPLRQEKLIEAQFVGSWKTEGSL